MSSILFVTASLINGGLMPSEYYETALRVYLLARVVYDTVIKSLFVGRSNLIQGGRGEPSACVTCVAKGQSPAVQVTLPTIEKDSTRLGIL